MEIKKKYKLCRRLGAGVFEKCQTPKFASVSQKRGRSDKKPKAVSSFGLQLIEKQKIRFGYGVTERQLSNYVKEASQVKSMPISDKLYELLEFRLDNVVYRLGLASTRRLARQMVAHGHFLVNGTRTTIPSYRVSVGDVVTIREGSKGSVLFSNIPEKMKAYNSPAWTMFDLTKQEGVVKGKPTNNENFINIGSVLEFYSR